MSDSLLREWKKALESDLESIIYELKDFLDTPALIILTGEVGVGKTTFVKSFVKLVIGDQLAFSPSYSLVNELGDLVHADFYRLQSSEEIIHLELGMYLEDKDYFIVEWGKDYLSEIESEIDDDFSKYELVFEMNPLKEGEEVATRNIKLISLDN